MGQVHGPGPAAYAHGPGPWAYAHGPGTMSICSVTGSREPDPKLAMACDETGSCKVREHRFSAQAHVLIMPCRDDLDAYS